MKKLHVGLLSSLILLGACKKDDPSPITPGTTTVNLLDSGTGWEPVFSHKYDGIFGIYGLFECVYSFSASSDHELMLSYGYRRQGGSDNNSCVRLHQDGSQQFEDGQQYRKAYYYKYPDGNAWQVDKGVGFDPNAFYWIRKNGSEVTLPTVPSSVTDVFHADANGIVNIGLYYQMFHLNHFNNQTEEWRTYYGLGGGYGMSLVPAWFDGRIHALVMNGETNQLKVYKGLDTHFGTSETLYATELLATTTLPFTSGTAGHVQESNWIQRGNVIYFVWENGALSAGAMEPAKIFSYNFVTQTLQLEVEMAHYTQTSSTVRLAGFDTDGNGHFYLMNGDADGNKWVEKYAAGNPNPEVLLGESDLLDDGELTSIKAIHFWNGMLYCVLVKSTIPESNGDITFSTAIYRHTP